MALKEREKIRADKPGDEEKGEARVSMTDPQARIMKHSDGGFAPSYNVPISTDAAAGAIVAVETVQSGSDYKQLLPAIDRIDNNWGQIPEQVVVAGGFISRENILAVTERGVELVGPAPDGQCQSAGQMNRRGVDPEYRPDACSYDVTADTYTCPVGKVLKYNGKEELPGRTNYRYRAQATECKACPFRTKCCPTNVSKGRMIVRGVDHPIVTAFTTRMQTDEAKAIYRLRGAIAEFPNAWIKAKIGLRQFRVRGLIKAGLEALWACLTYNVQLWVRCSWTPCFAI